jgi:threonyl-tRNA synthetase
MSEIRITLPDQSVKTFSHEPTTLEVAASIGPRLAKDTIGAIINDGKEVQDFRLPLKDGTKLRIITIKDKEATEVIRHSAAHVMAQAVQEIWPDVKVTIGPVIDSGFYYDFDSPRPFHPDDLTKIETKIKEICKRDLEIRREDVPSKQAIETFKKLGETYKVEIIEDLKSDSVSIYHQGEWYDLCRGPHVQRLGQIKAVKVLSLAGAYWRGDEKNAQLQRIYATAFPTQELLDEHLKNLEEAKKRDHRKLGKDLGLFTFHPWAPGSPFFAPAGATVYNELQTFIREKYFANGYQEVITPQIYDVDLFHKSGHFENYRENMYFSKIDERDFSQKPMNCPGHCLLYASEHRSYRDLPWRVADFGRLHRYERSGVMHGLTRVRSFSQDDAHIFCTMEQVQSEIESFMTFLDEVYNTLGMSNYHVFLSTRPEKRMGTEELWDYAEGALQKALEKLKLPFTINAGDGAFYGPKLDIMFTDSINRPWQLGTLQFDPNLPEAFSLGYVGEDNQEHRPVMLHRAILGSFERFIGVYLEHTGGALPTWIAPTQVRILNVTDAQADYCHHLAKEFKAAGVRAHFDSRAEKLGYKIREAQLQKVPYMMIIGDKERDSETVSLRLRNGQNVNGLKRDEFMNSLKKEISERKLVSPYWDASFVQPTKQGEVR